MRTWCWSGAGWAPARSRPRATRSIRQPIRLDLMNLWDDPRIQRGMTAQLKLRQQRLDAGDEPLGWKVGFGAPAIMKQFGISGPLVGFLTRNARIDPGGIVSFAGWTKPVAE